MAADEVNSEEEGEDFFAFAPLSVAIDKFLILFTIRFRLL